MGMLGEFFDYFCSVLSGRQDSLTAFLEPLTMGERYYHWGVENGDIRDFRTSLDYLHLCNDPDAPLASLLIRKYTCIGDATAAAVDSLVKRHNKVIAAALKTENDFRNEKATLQKTVSVAMEKMRTLQAEGSLIKAKGEEKHIEELKGNIAKLDEMLVSGEGRSEVYASYDRITSDAMRFFRELDQAAVMVELSPKLGPAAEQIAGQLRRRLEQLKERIEALNPIDEPKEKDNISIDRRKTGGDRRKPARK